MSCLTEIGLATTTSSSRDNAIMRYNEFSLTAADIPAFEDIHYFDIDNKNIIEYVTAWVNWMMGQKKPYDDSGKETFKWAPLSVAQMLSQFCCQLEGKSDRIKEHPLMRNRNDNGAWFSELKHRAMMRMHAWAVKNGVHFTKDTPSARKSTVSNMSRHLYSLDTAKSHKQRFLTILNYQSCHRGGEYANMSWSFFSWNADDGCINGDKRESKTGRDYNVPFCHSLDWQLDFFHSLACMLMTNEATVGAAGSDPLGIAPEFLFPEMYNSLPGKAANEVTKIFKLCYADKVGGVSSDMTSTSLRCGAADDMMINQHMDIIDAISR